MAVLLGVSGGAVIAVIVSSPAEAHCVGNGNTGHYYVAGGNGSAPVRAAQTKIEWVASPSICDSGNSNSISIVHGDGWVQAGNLIWAGYSRPMGYCERNPDAGGTGSYAISEYAVAQEAQVYTYARPQGSLTFDCRIGGETLRSTHRDWLGFGSGGWVPVQAEAHALHVQLGRVAPNWMRFSEAARKTTTQSGDAWSPMVVSNVGTGSPIWNWNQPNNFGFGVNTDASH
jgi:hypothetical protein